MKLIIAEHAISGLGRIFNTNLKKPAYRSIILLNSAIWQFFVIKMKINQIKNTTKIVLFITLLITSVGKVETHSGRTDAYGGHNCYVGSCAGTYHYHNGGTRVAPPIQIYNTPTPRVIYVPPTATPTLVPTNTPTPTRTPTPTVKPTSTPAPVVKQAVEEEPKRNTGFWGFILSLFGF